MEIMNIAETLTTGTLKEMAICSELSFAPVLNLMIIKGNPFEAERWIDDLQLLNRIEEHLHNGHNLNIYIKLTDINDLGRIFQLRLSQIIRKYESTSKIRFVHSGNPGSQEQDYLVMDLMNFSNAVAAA